MNDRDRSFVTRAFVVVLSISALAVIAVLLAGLFNPAVDNAMIFKILEPLTQVIAGALISTLSTLVATRQPPKEGEHCPVDRLRPRFSLR